jgi:hypothetical protein
MEMSQSQGYSCSIAAFFCYSGFFLWCAWAKLSVPLEHYPKPIFQDGGE